MKTTEALLAAVLLAGGIGVAVAQNAATYDPAQLPAIQGKVAQYSLTPRGDVDGLILADGTEVHLPPHLGPGGPDMGPPPGPGLPPPPPPANP